MDEDFKEFQAKDLDGAIQQACEYFDTDRARLEIEILQDAKSGIFGIVGVRKAKIRAKRVHVREAVQSILGKDNDSRNKARENHEKRPVPKPEQAREQKEQPRLEQDKATQPKNERQAPRTEQKKSEPRPERKRGKPAHAQAEQESGHTHGDTPRQAPANQVPMAREQQGQDFAETDDDTDAEGWGYPHTPLESLDRDTLLATVESVTRELIRPIAGTPGALEVTLEQGRVQVRLDCGEDSGLLIGREGMTLAALQYILSRVVSCKMNASVRVQLDAGDYRRHQEDKLREMAQGLAERARQTGRSYSTRPLSSYHRRIVHLALQGMEDIQSRSSGDGALKRVVISKRRAERNERNH